MTEEVVETKERPPEIRPEEKTLFIYGRDVSKIPCFRNTMVYGILGGLSLGLGHFLFTSRPRASTHFCFYSFYAITIVYWIQCRYQFSKTKNEMMRLQELLALNSVLEGTANDK